MSSGNWSWGTLSGVALLASGVAYAIAASIWNLYLSPLAKFPGPRIAALTLWYECYWDAGQRGRWMWKIRDMHRKYGPIVRINPYELHIIDPDYYDELYSGKRDKYKWWTNLAGADGSSFSTVSHDQHRLRRGAISPFFSKRSISQLEPLIKSKVEKLSSRFDQAIQTQEVVNLDAALMALTIDIICDYAFAADRKYLDEPDFKMLWKQTIMGGFDTGALSRHFPWVLPTMKSLPLSFVSAMDPNVGFLFRWQNSVREQVKPILDGKDREEDTNGRTIFHTLRDSNLPADEKTLERLCDEATIFTGAGSETTALTSTRIMFYLNLVPDTLHKLREELRQAIPDPNKIPLWNDLEHLPYLTAVIHEGLRLSPLTTRLPRVAEQPLQYRDWTIPAGTPVSETPYFVLMDPNLFPQPDTFWPERWIDAEKQGQRLDEYLVAFGRGTRQCVGVNLAYAELYLTIATLVRRFDWDLHDQFALSDAVCRRDAFVARSDLEERGLRITLRRAV